MSAGYTRTTVLAASLLLGLITASLLYLYAFSGKREAGMETPVVVASSYIPADTIISADMVRIVKAPQSDVLKDSATSLSMVNGLVTQTPFNEGEQISLARVIDKGTAYGLTGIIPPGRRAMSISVDASDAVSGFIRPGNKVDIIASFTQGSDSVARTILQDVPLLAVNGSMSRTQPTPEGGPEQPKPANAGGTETTSVTIAVTPTQAERLVAAQYKGKLKLGLRGLSDNSQYATSGTSLNRILGLPPEPGPRISTGRVAPPRPTVRVKPAPAQRESARIAKLPPGGVAPVIPALPGAGPGISEPTTIRVIRGTQVEDVPVAQ